MYRGPVKSRTEDNNVTHRGQCHVRRTTMSRTVRVSFYHFLLVATAAPLSLSRFPVSLTQWHPDASMVHLHPAAFSQSRLIQSLCLLLTSSPFMTSTVGRSDHGIAFKIACQVALGRIHTLLPFFPIPLPVCLPYCSPARNYMTIICTSSSFPCPPPSDIYASFVVALETYRLVISTREDCMANESILSLVHTFLLPFHIKYCSLLSLCFSAIT